MGLRIGLLPLLLVAAALAGGCGRGEHPEGGVIHIRRIRAKLGANYENMVETVRNVRCRFNDA